MPVLLGGIGLVYANITIMKRTTIYLDPELELLLKLKARRLKKPMSEMIREALRKELGAKERSSLPPGVGEFRSGLEDASERLEELLEEMGFGKR